MGSAYWTSGRITAGLAIVGVAMLGACSGKTTSTSTVGPIAAADLSQRYAEAICKGIQGCCGKAAFAYDAPACTAAAQVSLNDAFAKVMARPGLVYDPEAAGRCVAKVAEEAASCADLSEREALSAACDGVFTGALEVGQPCADSGACKPRPDGRVTCIQYASYAADLPDGGAGPSTSGSACTLLKPAAIGDPCGIPDTGVPASTQGDCQDNPKGAFYCDPKSKSCQPRAAAGQPCPSGNNNACAAGSVCRAGTCSAPAAGLPCTSFSNQCGDALYCDAGSNSKGKCVARKSPGEACEPNHEDECAIGRCSGGKCSAGELATVGACAGTTDRASSPGSAGPAPDGG